MQYSQKRPLRASTWDRSDAYHPLSIEGYRVTPALIERVRCGDWNPESSDADRKNRYALPARGYWQAFQLVKQAVEKIIAGADIGTISFFPRIGLCPTSWEAVRDAMPALFDRLESETEPAVRAVLSHWLFGYIHPYMDGNGRTARFLMNAMLASGGYPWTVVRVEDRARYLSALDAASIDLNIEPFISAATVQSGPATSKT